MSKPCAVLFVCLGNICRSPAGEGMLRQRVQEETFPIDLVVESCGLGNWHVGEPPDPRMQKAAKSRGVDLTALRAKVFRQEWFLKYDYILAADHAVLADLVDQLPTQDLQENLFLINDFIADKKGTDLPDPYWGEEEDFHVVLDLLEEACQGILVDIKQRFL